MKFIFTLAMSLLFGVSFAQWQRIEELPTDIRYVLRKDTVLYATGKAVVYISKNKGAAWDSSAHIPGFGFIDEFTVYRDELYAASFSFGIRKSRDGGATWENIENGIIPFLSGFVEWRGDLYASTMGAETFKLDPVTRNRWIPLNNGLSSLSINMTAIGANNNVLVGGTLNNRLYDRLLKNQNEWDELFINGNNSVSDGVSDIINSHDSLWMATRTNVYLSTDDALNWQKIGTPIFSTFTNLLNLNNGILAARNSFLQTNNTDYFILRKDGLQEAWINFSRSLNHFSYKMEIIDNKVWDASDHGLFFMPLSVLPGITAPDDTVVIHNGGDGSGNDPRFVYKVSNVFPNPVFNIGHIDITLDTSKQVSASIYDVSGKVVATPFNHQRLSKGKTILDLDMSRLAAGSYFLRLQIGGEMVVRKVLRVNF